MYQAHQAAHGALGASLNIERGSSSAQAMPGGIPLAVKQLDGAIAGLAQSVEMLAGRLEMAGVLMPQPPQVAGGQQSGAPAPPRAPLADELEMHARRLHAVESTVMALLDRLQV